jgi:hypothetical protein
MLWKGPLDKAIAKIEATKVLVRSLSLSTRILFVNVFIVSLFSYIALFFVLPKAIWGQFRAAVLKVFPFNGTAYPYEALVCGKQIFSIKPPLKDVWAFNVSLLAVRSRLFTNTSGNYHTLPYIKLAKNNMFIKDHRDAAAVDFWRSRHLPDGRLLPPSPPTSSEVYKVLVEDVYLEDALSHCNNKLQNFLGNSTGPPPPLPSPFPSIATTLRKFPGVSRKFLMPLSTSFFITWP